MKNTYDAVKQVHQQELQFGSEQFKCLIKFDDRKSLKITVQPDQRVIVNAPLTKSLSQVLDKVKKRAAWILKQRNYFEQFMPRLPDKAYVSGESFYYLGRQYRLKVIEGSSEEVKLIGRFFRVLTPDKSNAEHVKYLLDKWYRQHAMEVFERRLNVCHESAKRYGIIRPAIKIRAMQKRWGSCNSSHHILLNTQLVKAPIHCIDYVITHELCHLKYPSHSQYFYRLLSRLQPDWQIRKERLEKVLL